MATGIYQPLFHVADIIHIVCLEHVMSYVLQLSVKRHIVKLVA